MVFVVFQELARYVLLQLSARNLSFLIVVSNIVKMSRLQSVRHILTERLNAVAEEIFGEVRSIVEEYCDENNRLRNLLHMVINPEIDVCPYTGAPTEKPFQPKLEIEIPAPPTKKPKEEEIETDISWGTEQQDLPREAVTFIKPDCVKSESDEEDPSVPCITDLYQINVVDYSPDSSATISDEEVNSGQEESFLELDTDSGSSQAFGGDETAPENQELHTYPASSNINDDFAAADSSSPGFISFCSSEGSNRVHDYQEKKMNTSMFDGKRKPGLETRVPPTDSDDSCLSDSGDSDGDSDEDCIPAPGDESSSSSDDNGDGDCDAPVLPSTSTAPAATAAKAAATKGRIQRVEWKTVGLNSAKEVPVWQDTLPEADAVRLPIQYFRDFFDTDLLNSIVEQSNLYCAQKNPNSALKLDLNELEQFIGTVIYMSVLHLPRSRMYWSSACRLPHMADVMPRDRWEEIKHFIHFADNTAPNSGDRLFKIRPLIDALLPKFQALPQDQMLSVNEQMVPLKGRSSLKQCIPKKPYKWGYKIFVLCDTKGLVHSFDVFAGKTDPAPTGPDIGTSGNIVLKLAQVVQSSVNHLLYFDSWFSSLELFVALANSGIPALGTVQQNCLQGCSFSTDAEMQEKGRETFEEKQAVVDNVQIRAVKWFENRGVIVASTFASAQPVSTVERWDGNLKKKVFVECPSIISLYNKFIGGVDALDALTARYRICIRSKRYYHRFFFHFVDMVIVNSWLLFRRDCESLNIPKDKQGDLLSFRTSVAQALCMQGKDLSKKKRGRPSLDVEREFEKKRHRGPTKAIPTQEVRADAVGHWPVVESSRQRCKLPNCKGQTVFKCSKCHVNLCLNKKNNCFRDFHE